MCATEIIGSRKPGALFAARSRTDGGRDGDEAAHSFLEADDLEPLAEPVLEAVRTGGVQQVRAVMEWMPDAVEDRSHIYVYNALELAIAMGKVDVAQALLELGADPSAWSHEPSTPLSTAMTSPASTRDAVIVLLEQHGVRAHTCDLEAAASTGKLELLDRVLALPAVEDDKEYDVPTLTELHARTLEGAARAGDIAAMEAVIARSPEPTGELEHAERAARLALDAPGPPRRDYLFGLLSDIALGRSDPGAGRGCSTMGRSRCARRQGRIL